jgi:hypothetical protein
MSRKELMSDIVMARKAIGINRAKKVIRACFKITKRSY